MIATLREGEQLEVLYGQQIVDGLVWIEVQDMEGRVGWIPAFYIQTITPTPVPTTTLTPTATQLPPSPTFTPTPSPPPGVTATP